MQTNTAYIIFSIIVVAIVTWSLRSIPFLIFGNIKLPKVVKFLGYTLPSSIMVILVFYCIRDIDFTKIPYGLHELISISIVVIVHIKFRNTYLSIIIGTICYMILY